MIEPHDVADDLDREAMSAVRVLACRRELGFEELAPAGGGSNATASDPDPNPENGTRLMFRKSVFELYPNLGPVKTRTTRGLDLCPSRDSVEQAILPEASRNTRGVPRSADTWPAPRISPCLHQPEACGQALSE
jgi:hypothetical protein